jgi:tetratricopeptide (TPR) repeat protein
LEQSPDWGASDLSELLDASPTENPVPVMWLHTGSSPLPVPYLAANALLATGQREAAQKILGPLQDRHPGLDRCFELLIALKGTNAIPQLDDWFKRDQFEERPLIWKAHLLRQEGQLEAAEQTIRQAISIDPSDGEEGRGDRMRAYAELAEIRAGQGDPKEADFYREVVKAIRMSEDADQYYQAGLLKRAIKLYEQGLNHFSDAYCIQSRLAIQMAALGQNAEAEEHYRRAYELMPDSFGRVESHCFGCEKAFDGEHAQGIAERVFTQFASAHPDKPQVYYLLGYLRTEEERFAEARTNYLTAVRLDPDYLNAWVKLQEADEQVLVPARERDQVAFNILRLDPLRRHTCVSFASVTDLAGLWQAAATAAALQSPPATNLMTLTASKLAQAKSKTGSRQAAMIAEMVQERVNNQMGRTPAALVAQTSFVSLAGQMIMNNNSQDQ